MTVKKNQYGGWTKLRKKKVKMAELICTGMTIKDACAEAGLNPTSAYYHWKSSVEEIVKKMEIRVVQASANHLVAKREEVLTILSDIGRHDEDPNIRLRALQSLVASHDKILTLHAKVKMDISEDAELADKVVVELPSQTHVQVVLPSNTNTVIELPAKESKEGE